MKGFLNLEVEIGGEVFESDSDWVEDEHESWSRHFEVLTDGLFESGQLDERGRSRNSEVRDEGNDRCWRDSASLQGDESVESARIKH